MLVLEIEASKPPIFDLKSCQRHRNDLSTCCSVLACPSMTKNTGKLPTQSAEKWICMEKWVVRTLANFIHEVVVIGHLWSCTGFFVMTAYLRTPK